MAANRAAGGIAGGFTVNVLSASEASAQAAAKHGQQSSALTSLGETFKDVGLQAISFGAGMLGLQLGQDILSNLATALVAFPEQISKATITFQTFTGSAQMAATLISQMEGLSGTTPFHFEALAQTAQTLIALGTPAEEVAARVHDIAVAVAAVGGGDSDLQRVATSLSRIQATGVVTALTMRQLMTEGINSWGILEAATGKTEAELAKMMKTGQVTSDMLMSAFADWAAAKGPDVLAQSLDTVGGAMTVVQNQSQLTMATALAPLTDRLTEAAAAAARFAGSDDFKRWGTSTADTITSLLNALDSINLRVVAAGAGIVGLAVFLESDLFAGLQLGIEGFGAFAGEMGVAFAATVAEEGALAGVSAAAQIAKASFVGLLGPVGAAAVAVGVLAIGYETNFLGIRDATDRTTSRVVEDAGILIASFNRIRDAAANAPSTSLDNLMAGRTAGTMQGPPVPPAPARSTQLDALMAQTTTLDSLLHQLPAAVMAANEPIARLSDQYERMGADVAVASSRVRLSRDDFEAQKLGLNDADAAAGGYTAALGAVNLALAQEAALSNAVLLAQNAPVARGADQYDGQTLATVATTAAQSALLASYDKIPKAAAAAGSAIAGVGQNALLALPGLSALDMAIAGTQSKLAAVQLQIEEKVFARMQTRPMTSLGGQEAFLQEQLKIEQLQKAAGYDVGIQGIAISNANTTAANQAASHAAAVARQPGGSVTVHVNGPLIQTGPITGAADENRLVTKMMTALNQAASSAPGRANVQLAGVR